MKAFCFVATLATTSVAIVWAGGHSKTHHHSSSYRLVDKYQGSTFFNGWNFWSDADPTHGTVQYVNRVDAMSRGLAKVSNGIAYMKADTTSVTTNGRPSVRISSKKVYNYGLFVVDLKHMPTGCGTWPAFWTVPNSGWPYGGEIDILEGVNTQTKNLMTLHTPEGCTMEGSARKQKGSTVTPNCDINAPGQSNNQGCGVSDPSSASYGKKFNSAGGGIFAMEWTSKGIKVWHFTHSKAPHDLKSASPNPNSWPTPSADFPGTHCDISKFFKNHAIVFDLTFCGDWAGAVFNQNGCPGTCADFVNNNPKAFKEAYWAVNYVKVFQK